MESTPHAVREERLGDAGIAEKKEERKETLEAHHEVRAGSPPAGPSCPSRGPGPYCAHPAEHMIRP